MNTDDYRVCECVGGRMYERRDNRPYYTQYSKSQRRVNKVRSIFWWDYVSTLMIQLAVDILPDSWKEGGLISNLRDSLSFEIPEKKSYDIAVIIPTLNEEKFLSRCLKSVINQTFPFTQMDVMVVDGGSIDNTKQIVEEYHQRYDNIRLIDNPGKIQSIAFNIGVKESSAPYIIRLDAHAFYKSYYIEGCLKGLKEDSKRGNVGGQWDIQPQNDSIWAVTNAILNYSWFGIGGASYRIGAKAGNVDTVPFGAFPRKVIEKIGGMREDLPRGEDNEYNSRIRKAGYDIYFDPSIECIYYARPTLMASIKQMYANGISIGHLFYIDKDSIGIRHLIPFFFVVGIIVGIIGTLIWKPIGYALVAGLVLYFVCDFLASFIQSIKSGWKYLISLFILFFFVHVSYGFGTIVGLLSRIKIK